MHECFYFSLVLVLASWFKPIYLISSLYFLRALCVLFSSRALRENNLRIIFVINFHAKAAKLGFVKNVNSGSIGIEISH